MKPFEFKNDSHVKSAQFDEESGVLTVHFKNSKTAYHYGRVKLDEFEALKVAESPGKWINANLKAEGSARPFWKDGDPVPDLSTPAPVAAPPAAATEDVPEEPKKPKRGEEHAHEPAIKYADQPADVRETAARRYGAYARNCGGKAWDGRPMPTWSELVAGGSPVVGHWCAVVLDERAEASSSNEADVIEANVAGRLRRDLEEAQAKIAKLSEGGAFPHMAAFDKAVLDRTKDLQAEVDRLSAEIAKR